MSELPRYRYDPGPFERKEPDQTTVGVRCTCPECDAVFHEEADVPPFETDDEGFWIYDGKAGTGIAFVQNRDLAELIVERLNEAEEKRRQSRAANEAIKAHRERKPGVAELWSENGL